MSQKYDEYLTTDYWKQVSDLVKKRAGYKCQLCNSPHDLRAHHRTYDHRGRELAYLDDLTCLCRRCHNIFHGLHDPQPIVQQEIPRKKKFKHKRKTFRSYGEPPIIPSAEIVLITSENHKRLRSNKEMYHWMVKEGIDPKIKGWAKRAIGQTVPLHYLYPEVVRGIPTDADAPRPAPLSA